MGAIFKRKSIEDLEQEFSRTIKNLAKDHNLEEEDKEVSDVFFEETLDRKISFYANYSRIDSSLF